MAPKTARKSIGKKNKLTLALVGIAGLFTLAIGVLVIGYSYLNYKYTVVPDGEAGSVVFDVPRGSGLSSIAGRLEAGGIIETVCVSPWPIAVSHLADLYLTTTNGSIRWEACQVCEGPTGWASNLDSDVTGTGLDLTGGAAT